MDYQGNANKDKEEKEQKEQKQTKKVEKVVTGEVVQKPKGIGRKFKDIFFGGDAKQALRFVTADVLLPALRDLVYNSISKGVENIVYGERFTRRRPPEYRPRVSYNNPFAYRPPDPRDQRAHLPDQTPRSFRSERFYSNRREISDIVIPDRAEAEAVIAQMIDIIDKYQAVSLADFYEIVGLESSHVDNKWGWTYSNNVNVRQVRDGYLLELPPLEEL